MTRIQSQRAKWHWAACTAAMLVSSVHAMPNRPDATGTANPYAIGAIRATPVPMPFAIEPVRNDFVRPGVVVDVHGRELASTIANAEPALRPGFGAPPNANVSTNANPNATVAPANPHAGGSFESGRATAPGQIADGAPGAQGLPPPVAAVVPQVPEPSSFVLMGAGLAALLAYLRTWSSAVGGR